MVIMHQIYMCVLLFQGVPVSMAPDCNYCPMQSHQDVVVSIAPPHGTSFPMSNNEMNFTINNSDTEMMMTQLISSKKAYSQPVLSEQYKTERDSCTKQFDSWSEQEQV